MSCPTSNSFSRPLGPCNVGVSPMDVEQLTSEAIHLGGCKSVRPSLLPQREEGNDSQSNRIVTRKIYFYSQLTVRGGISEPGSSGPLPNRSRFTRTFSRSLNVAASSSACFSAGGKGSDTLNRLTSSRSVNRSACSGFTCKP